MKLIDYLDDWIENFHKHLVKHQTYVRYKSNINNYIRPSPIANMELEDVTRKDVQAFVNSLRSVKGKRTGLQLSPGTINNTYVVLQCAYNHAEEYELITRNPCQKIRRIPVPQDDKNTKCFTIAEQRKIEQYIDSLNRDEYYCYILDLYTGLRIGELCALRWEDIDFSTKTLYVTSAVYSSTNSEGHWELITDTPKSRTSIRDIPLPPHIVKLLNKLWRHSKSEYVCSKADGTRITPWTCRNIYERMLQTLGIRHLNFHCLRHTFATRAIENGMDFKTLSVILGHASPSITMNIYTHSTEEHKRGMMNLMKKLK